MEQEGCRTTTIGKQWKVSVVLGIAGADRNILWEWDNWREGKENRLEKQFEGVHWENWKGVRKNEIESWKMGRQVLYKEEIVYI